MLRFETLPASLAGVLSPFRSCFTAPTFRLFCLLVAGMIARPARRTVCGMLIGAGVSQVMHHARAHWFFAGARWRVDQVGAVLARLIVAWFVAADAPVCVAVDATLFRRSGRRVHGAAWHHDGSVRAPRGGQVSYGTGFVIAGIIVALPVCARPVCLPVLARLWRPGSTPQTVILCRLVEILAQALAGRQIHVVADAHYAGADGERGLPAGVTLTSRPRHNAVFSAVYTGAQPRAGRRRVIGERLGTAADLAARAVFTPALVRRYGHATTVDLAEICCLWYGVYRCRAIRVIVLREPDSTARAGYDLALVTTDLHSPAAQIVARYADRWSIEVAIEDAKTITGVGEARNRIPTAVERTVPFGLITQSIVVCWYARHGHHPDVITARRAEAPWYRTKTQPAYLDMIVQLRRVLIAARFRAGKAEQPNPHEIAAIHMAWAEAAA